MSRNDPEFDKLTQLDRLEELREEMQELGVTSLADIDEWIARLELEIDDLPAEDATPDGPV